MNRTRTLLAAGLALEGAFVALCLTAPFLSTPEQNGLRQAVQLALTAGLLVCGAIACLFAARGARLWEVAICLLLLGPIHFVAGGTQPELVWLPITIGFGSLVIAVSLAWRNA